MKKLLMIMGVILLFLVAGNVQCSAQEGVLHGCVSKKSGSLRIVSDPSECKKGEQAISWNQVGPQGEQGEKGERGDQGDAGTDGLDCWDLNANRTCDPEEDKNIDGICDALDCIGAVHVYDADDQYLGVFAGTRNSYWKSPNDDNSPIEIFIPSLNIPCYIDLFTGNIAENIIYFSNGDCMGTKYATYSSLFYNAREIAVPNQPRYFIGSLQKTKVMTYSYHRGGDDDTCVGSSGLYELSAVDHIEEEDIPFTLPVALPLRYEQQDYSQ